jgi:hypothetical protein
VTFCAEYDGYAPIACFKRRRSPTDPLPSEYLIRNQYKDTVEPNRLRKGAHQNRADSAREEGKCSRLSRGKPAKRISVRCHHQVVYFSRFLFPRTFLVALNTSRTADLLGIILSMPLPCLRSRLRRCIRSALSRPRESCRNQTPVEDCHAARHQLRQIAASPANGSACS